MSDGESFLSRWARLKREANTVGRKEPGTASVVAAADSVKAAVVAGEPAALAGEPAGAWKTWSCSINRLTIRFSIALVPLRVKKLLKYSDPSVPQWTR